MQLLLVHTGRRCIVILDMTVSEWVSKV